MLVNNLADPNCCTDPRNLCPRCQLVIQQKLHQPANNRRIEPLPLPTINWNEPVDKFGNPIPEPDQDDTSATIRTTWDYRCR